MNMRKVAILIAAIMAAIGAILLTVLPMSANLIIAFVFYLLGVLMMVVGILMIDKKNPASFAAIFKCNTYTLLSLVLSALALSLSMKVKLHVVLQIVLFLLNLAKILLIDMGKNYIDRLDKQAQEKREGK